MKINLSKGVDMYKYPTRLVSYKVNLVKGLDLFKYNRSGK